MADSLELVSGHDSMIGPSSQVSSDTIANEDLESSGVIIDVAQHHLTVGLENFLYLCVL